MKINTYQEKFLSKNWCFFYVSLLAGNFTVEKKVCTFELCLALIKKYSKSFGEKNLASSARFFSHRKPWIYFVLILDSVQIRKNCFPFGNPPYAKKRKRDSLYFDLLPGPLNSADFFLFTCTVNKRQRRDKHTIQVFLSLLFFLLLRFEKVYNS